MTTEDSAVEMEYLSEMSIVSMATRKGEVLTCNSITREVIKITVNFHDL